MMYEAIDFDQIDITGNPPEEEPARQYYFIAKCRQYVKQESEAAGHGLSAAVVTFGCQMNTEREIEKAAKMRLFLFRVEI